MSDPHPPKSSGDRVATYFSEMRGACQQATQGAPPVQRTLAGRTLAFNIAGERLSNVLQQALSHLPLTEHATPDFTLYAWDESATGVARPPAPWPWPSSDQAVELSLPPGSEDFFPLYDALRKVFGLYQKSTRTAVLWVHDARLLPTSWYGAPLFRMFHWWSQSAGLALLHAACVGNENGGVLLAGKGGSGKSTTSLLCLAAGLNYVSDDYCLLETSPRPRAHCLYSTGKLNRAHLARFPSLAACAVDPAEDDFDKKVIFTHQHFPQQLAGSLPLRAILLPRIMGRDTAHRLIPINAGEALRGLAPSTLFQVSGHGAEHFRIMADLVRRIPCLRLELGTDFTTIPEVIASFLNTPAAPSA